MTNEILLHAHRTILKPKLVALIKRQLIKKRIQSYVEYERS